MKQTTQTTINKEGVTQENITKQEAEALYLKKTDALLLTDQIPLEDGVESAGTSTKAAHGDHVHPVPAGIAKNMYNLGAYDTYVSNGDGTGTVTRKTGYYKLGGDYIAWYHNDAWSNEKSFAMVEPSLTNLYNSNSVSDIYIFSSRLEVASVDGVVFGSGNLIGAGDGGKIFISITGCETADEINEDLSKNPIFIQYKLNELYQYTELVIENQPINTLNQEGEQWLREEWEKGLNLIDPWTATGISSRYNIRKDGLFIGIATVDSRAWNYSNSDIFLTLSAGTYTILNDIVAGTQDSNFGVQGRLSDGTYLFGLSTSGQSESFTLSNEATIGVMFKIYQCTLSLMLTKGNDIYPYKPYNGKIIHEKDLENYLPKSGGTVDGNLDVTGTLSRNGEAVPTFTYNPATKTLTIT